MCCLQPERESEDRTADPAWIQEQVDRLLGWEYLQMALGCGDGEMDERRMADKLGIAYQFWYSMLQRIRSRLYRERLKDAEERCPDRLV